MHQIIYTNIIIISNRKPPKYSSFQFASHRKMMESALPSYHQHEPITFNHHLIKNIK